MLNTNSRDPLFWTKPGKVAMRARGELAEGGSFKDTGKRKALGNP